jgi:hypothetical protein
LGDCLLWAVFLIPKVSHIWATLFSHGKFCAVCNLDSKMDWATLWAIFSQTHLVTLLRREDEEREDGGGTWTQGDDRAV